MHTTARPAALALMLAALGCGGSANVAAYRQCTADSDCAAQMACVPVLGGLSEKVCAPSCAADTQCPASPSASAGAMVRPYCSTDHRCRLGCSGAGACDTDLTCRFNALAGGYAYCY